SAGCDSSNYGQAVFVPAAADRAVLALRQWITKQGSGGPAWDKNYDRTLPPRERNREALFNVYEVTQPYAASFRYVRHRRACATSPQNDRVRDSWTTVFPNLVLLASLLDGMCLTQTGRAVVCCSLNGVFFGFVVCPILDCALSRSDPHFPSA
ncbi:unnamed protein product, partial [Ectocarpus sp. 12 AP-2014]